MTESLNHSFFPKNSVSPCDHYTKTKHCLVANVTPTYPQKVLDIRGINKNSTSYISYFNNLPGLRLWWLHVIRDRTAAVTVQGHGLARGCGRGEGWGNHGLHTHMGHTGGINTETHTDEQQSRLYIGFLKIIYGHDKQLTTAFQMLSKMYPLQ